MPGKIIELSGFGDRFNGKAYVTGVRHELSNGKWSTDIQFGLSAKWFSATQDFNALPAAGMLPSVDGVQIGVVTELENDPDDEFRIRVRLPLLGNDEEGVWARMVKSYAGSDYGICFHPEIDDEVIVAFLNNDPRKAVVIGMLHSSAKPSPIEPKDDNYQKGIITKSELKVLWDDEKKIITVSTPGGNEIVLDDDEKKISMKDSNQNSIEMSSSGITIESSKALTLKAGQNIDIEGLNISHNANGKFTAEGAAGAEVKTGSIAVLKGSLVQIN
jgi:Rhs element Vgr protein